MDGLARVAQIQGAAAVLATLWPVSDVSTPALMRRFYELREREHLSKAEALGRAQVEMATGRLGLGEAAARGVAPEVANASAPPNTASVTNAFPGWTHPYYWAPFILLGMPVDGRPQCQGDLIISAQFKMARSANRKQGLLRFVTWGGAREGAGRPKKPGAKLRHEARAAKPVRYPAHVTLRTVGGAPNLRRASVYAVVEGAIRTARARGDFRIVHFTMETNHLHAIVEANDARALSRGMQGLAIRIARGVNRVAQRKGKLWADRFHARALRSPREVRNAICYVLQNTRRHATTDRGIVDPTWIDPRSSGPWFDGWRRPDGDVSVSGEPPPTSAPRTWLLSTGWRRCGLIRVDEVPRVAFS